MITSRKTGDLAAPSLALSTGDGWEAKTPHPRRLMPHGRGSRFDIKDLGSGLRRATSGDKNTCHDRAAGLGWCSGEGAPGKAGCRPHCPLLRAGPGGDWSTPALREGKQLIAISQSLCGNNYCIVLERPVLCFKYDAVSYLPLCPALNRSSSI